MRAVLPSRLYRERLSQVNSKLAEVEAGRAAEYLEPLAVLLENMQVRTKVAGNSDASTRTRKRSRGLATPIHALFVRFSRLRQVSTESCVWNQSRTSMSVRPRQPASTGRSDTQTHTLILTHIIAEVTLSFLRPKSFHDAIRI